MYVRTLRRTDATIVTRAIGIVLFALATALSARMSILIPGSPVPLTLQVLVVILSGYMLGGRDAALAQALYLQAILLGAPLTASGLAGPAAFLSPTAGYLISFPIAALAAGSVSRRSGRTSAARRLLAGALALGIVYSLGTLWLAGYLGSLSRAFAAGVVPFVGTDLLKVALAAALLSLPRR